MADMCIGLMPSIRGIKTVWLLADRRLDKGIHSCTAQEISRMAPKAKKGVNNLDVWDDRCSSHLDY